MEKFEKVEKLRERANVSYEEAQKALEENEWDLLDAMVALEKSGKTSSPKQQQYSTSYDEQKGYISVKTKVEQQQNEKPHLGRSIGEAFQSFFRICRQNWFCIRRNQDLMLRVPLFAVIILLIFTWKFAIPILLVALLFGFRYSLEGKDDLAQVNAFMNSAGAAAESLKEGFQNARERERSAGSTAAGFDATANSTAGFDATANSAAGFDATANSTAGFDATANSAAGFDATANSTASADDTAADSESFDNTDGSSASGNTVQ